MDSLQFPSLSSVLGSPTPSDVTPKPAQNGDVSEEDSDDFSDDSSEMEDEEDMSWIDWYTHLSGNEYFAEIDEDFLRDDFNLTGLSGAVSYYEHAMDLILGEETALEHFTEEQQELIDESAEILYGLVHARYIITTKGMQQMHEKYQAVHFGRCQRVYCHGQPLLPNGLSDLPGTHTVTLFCPSCQDVYYPRSSKHAQIDGAYFGTTFAHLFLLSTPAAIPPRPTQTFVPRIFGFRISKESPYYKAETPPAPVKRGKITVNVVPSPPEGATPSEPGTPLAVTPVIEYGEMKSISPQFSNLTL